MNKHNASLLPYILDLLSQRPEQSMSFLSIRDAIPNVILAAHFQSFHTLDDAVKHAIDTGMKHKFLSLRDGEILISQDICGKKLKKKNPLHKKKKKPKMKKHSKKGNNENKFKRTLSVGHSSKKQSEIARKRIKATKSVPSSSITNTNPDSDNKCPTT